MGQSEEKALVNWKIITDCTIPTEYEDCIKGSYILVLRRHYLRYEINKMY